MRDIQDISLDLKLSVGDEKNGGSTADNYLDSGENAADGKGKLEHAGSLGTPKAGSTYRSGQHVGGSKSSALRKRKYLVVIAVDGNGTTDFLESIKMIVKTVRQDKSVGSMGFILSTSLAISEMHSLLVSGGLSHLDFDAFICNSGAELYYPSATSEDGTQKLPFLLDSDYHSHIEYRWGGEHLRKTLLRWAASTTDGKGEEGPIVSEDKSGSTTHCFVFKVEKPKLVNFLCLLLTNFAQIVVTFTLMFVFLQFWAFDYKLFLFVYKVPSIRELRKSMRIQALRCHVIYCQNGDKLNVIPVLASRSQALRYVHQSFSWCLF